MTHRILDHLKADAPNALARYMTFLTIPTVSTQPEHKPDIARGAEWVADLMRQAGLDAKVMPTAGHPVVLGTTPDGYAPPGAPSVLIYTHYDVQPPEPLELWTTPPFTPTIRDGAVYARGAADDKGHTCCILEALRAWHVIAKRHPIRVIMLVEGEEEIGSPSLQDFLAAHRNELAADAAIVADSGMWDLPASKGGPVPAITYALRGLAYFDVQLHGPNRDLHSGDYGGTLANPALELAAVLARLLDDKRRVTVPGFYDDVLTLGADERRRLADLGFDERDFLGDIGVKQPCGEAGYSTLERRWARPSCDVNGLYGGYGGLGAKTVLPSFAGAKVSFRLVPNQDALKIGRAFEAWLRGQDVHGCSWKIEQHSAADPALVPTDSPAVATAMRAMKKTSGGGTEQESRRTGEQESRPSPLPSPSEGRGGKSGGGRDPVLIRCGGTIPVVNQIKRTLGLESLVLGFGLSGDRPHSPNEKFDLANFDLACRTFAVLLEELAG